MAAPRGSMGAGSHAIGMKAFVGLFVLALLVRAVPLLRGGGLTGDLGYDDGVYFASAVAFVHGLLPYRDFLLLQPPGIVLLLSPFAAFGSVTSDGTGMALARLAFMCLGAANALLVAVIAGRYRPRAGLVAGVLYATWYGAAGFENTTLLVPPQTALLLGSVWLLGSGDPGPATPARRAVAAGGLMGLAVAIQLWAVVPLVVLGGWLLFGARRSSGGALRPVIGFGAGALAVLAVVLVPFALASGPVMARYLVTDQAGRPPLDVSLAQRLRYLEGLRRSGALIPGFAVVAVAGVGLAVMSWAVARVAAVRVWALLFLAQSIVVLSIPVFFPHYAAWAAAPAAILLGTGATDLASRVAPLRRGRLLVGATAAIAVVLLLGPNVPAAGTHLPLAAAAQDVAAAPCVASDEPSLLVQLGVIGRLIARGCPIVVDPTGVSYDTDLGHLPPGPVERSRPLAVAYQETMEAYYGAAGAALFLRRTSDGFDADTWAALRCALPATRQLGPVLVLLRINAPSVACP